jgi:hypothetical protein
MRHHRFTFLSDFVNGVSARIETICYKIPARLSLGSISAIFLVMPILSAQSDELPILNVLPLCRGIVSQGADPLQAGERSVSVKECLDAEQDDRATMKNEWSTFSATDRRHCIAEATMGGESSYTDLVTCLEMARDVRKLRLPEKP